MDEIITWLLEGPPWVQYRTRLDLLDETEDNPQVTAARQVMVADPQVQTLLAELSGWPGPTLTSHKNAGHLLHKLAFIADLGFRVGDAAVDRITTLVLEHRSADGPFQVLLNVPTHFGGTGEDQWTWMLCDAPVLVYALLKFGLEEDPRVQAAVYFLANLIRANGWPCAASPELGKFRGPGRKDDPCPYANLVMLKALAQTTKWLDSEPSHVGAETLLTLWAQRRESHPYLFHMGTDFCKLKAPLVWYDILSVLDVLTRFPCLRADTRLREMVSIVTAKVDEGGRFTAESVWKAWVAWEFGQKRTPSRWLTLLIRRMLKRLAT